METRTCTGCKKQLPETDFHKKGDTARHSKCRTCRAKERVSVKREALTYTQGGEHSFFADAIRYRERMDSKERIDRHMREMGEPRAVTTGGGAAGLIPPAYLGAEYALVSRSGRPFADVVPQLPLEKSGTSFTIPQFTTGETVDSQNPENSAPSSTDMVSTTVSSTVVEIAGSNDFSRQAFERIYPGVDTVVYADLRDAYDEKLDAQLLNGSGSNNQHLGLRNVSSPITVTYTSGTPTAAGIANAILQAASKMGTQRKKWPTHVVLHPRRYAFLQADSGTAALMDHEDEDLGQITYVLDPNVTTAQGAGTNQDEIYVVYSPDFRLAEDVAPLFKFEDVATANGTLTLRAQFYSYSLFFGQRNPKAIAIVSGTGLTAPSGF